MHKKLSYKLQKTIPITKTYTLSLLSVYVIAHKPVSTDKKIK